MYGRLWLWVSLMIAIALADELPARNEPSHSTSQPCNPNPCGPNTACSPNEKGDPTCLCLKGFTKSQGNAKGCTLLCKRNDDCPSDNHCDGGECKSVCISSACPSGSECIVKDHASLCKCPEGTYGEPKSEKGCIQHQLEMKVNEMTDSTNSSIRQKRMPASCKEMDECPRHMVCRRFRCEDPCIGLCGHNAVCNVVNHNPSCECYSGYYGDPYTRCTSTTYNSNSYTNRVQYSSDGEGCPPNICGEKAECEMRRGTAHCKCPEGHYGNPLYRCTPECETDGDCSSQQYCERFRCKESCYSGVCVPGALCTSSGHRPVCRCPPGYLGSPETRCYAECMEHSHCPASKACFEFKCKNPCDNACGTNANCEVRNHKAVCSCPKGMTGHPFEYCRPFTAEEACNPNKCGTNAECRPGRNKEGYLQAYCYCPPGYYGDPLNVCRRGECANDDECANTLVCRNSQCINPCTDAGCGINANCQVRQHRVYCICPDGYSGNAFERCFPVNYKQARYYN